MIHNHNGDISNDFGVISTVSFHSIQQSCVMGPSKMLKCHSCHGDFYGVPNSFGNHVSNIENFLSPAALNC